MSRDPRQLELFPSHELGLRPLRLEDVNANDLTAGPEWYAKLKGIPIDRVNVCDVIFPPKVNRFCLTCDTQGYCTCSSDASGAEYGKAYGT